MPVTVSWDDQEPDVLLLMFEGRWTWDELFAAGGEVVEMASSRPRRVDVISDMFSAPYRPPHFEDKSNQLLLNTVQPPNMRIVVLTVDAFQYTMFKSYATRNDLSFCYAFAPCIDEGRELIQASRRGESITDFVPTAVMERN